MILPTRTTRNPRQATNALCKNTLVFMELALAQILASKHSIFCTMNTTKLVDTLYTFCRATLRNKTQMVATPFVRTNLSLGDCHIGWMVVVINSTQQFRTAYLPITSNPCKPCCRPQMIRTSAHDAHTWFDSSQSPTPRRKAHRTHEEQPNKDGKLLTHIANRRHIPRG
eukprot:SAG31_NODE_699_length_12741_cov_5.762617_13_plen_169_part_00